LTQKRRKNKHHPASMAENDKGIVLDLKRQQRIGLDEAVFCRKKELIN
jgi:hypothetical protein